jgi:hypothetical protein
MSNHHTSEDGSSFTETSVTDAPQSGQGAPVADATPTPRPWKFHGEFKHVGEDADRTLHWVGQIIPAYTTPSYRGPICDLQSCDHLKSGITRDEAAANAALIVRAVNRDHHFEALVKALEMGVQVWSQVLANRYNEAPEDVREPVLNAMRAVLTAALSLSEPKS